MRFRHDDCTVGKAFAGLDVGIEVIDSVHVRFWLHKLDLGVFETYAPIWRLRVDPRLLGTDLRLLASDLRLLPVELLLLGGYLLLLAGYLRLRAR